MDVILNTSIKPPKLTNKFLRRIDIINSLEENSYKKLITLTSPAGYGKTSLILDYLNYKNKSYCWLQIDSNMDNLYS